jgi:hypothetical protein
VTAVIKIVCVQYNEFGERIKRCQIFATFILFSQSLWTVCSNLSLWEESRGVSKARDFYIIFIIVKDYLIMINLQLICFLLTYLPQITLKHSPLQSYDSCHLPVSLNCLSSYWKEVLFRDGRTLSSILLRSVVHFAEFSTLRFHPFTCSTLDTDS